MKRKAVTKKEVEEQKEKEHTEQVINDLLMLEAVYNNKKKEEKKKEEEEQKEKKQTEQTINDILEHEAEYNNKKKEEKKKAEQEEEDLRKSFHNVLEYENFSSLAFKKMWNNKKKEEKKKEEQAEKEKWATMKVILPMGLHMPKTPEEAPEDHYVPSSGEEAPEEVPEVHVRGAGSSTD